MADLNDDRKKEEEEYGGFEPDESDDESFMLEDENDYPAKLPDKFSDEPSSTVRVTASVDSVDDDETETEEVQSEEPIEETTEEVDETDESIIDEEYNEETESDELIEDELDTEEIEEEESPSEEIEDDSIEFDDDFKKKLQEDIDKSKAKREAKEVLEEPQEDSEPAKQIGDDAETVVMLSDIDADKPSNVKPEETEELLPVVDSEPNEIESEEIEEEKKKKTPVWILMLYSSVATLLITLGAVWLIWAFMLSDTEEHNPDEPENHEVVTNHEEHTPEHKKKAVVADSMSEEEKKWLDSMDIDRKDTLITYQEDKEFFAGLEDEFDEEGHSKDKPKENQVDKNKPKKVKPKVVPKKKKTQDIASNNVSKSVAPKEKKKSKVEIDESEFSMPQPKGPAPETGLFMVQIYSSPSREDAESWLGQLKARQVPNPMITEHELRGRTWYRVRYGKFETKEAARSSALELGYSQSWIDRVK